MLVGPWTKQLLTENFITMDVEAILNIPPSSKVQSNVWEWHYEKKAPSWFDQRTK